MSEDKESGNEADKEADYTQAANNSNGDEKKKPWKRNDSYNLLDLDASP